MRDTTEVFQFIEPYKCIQEFVTKKYLDQIKSTNTTNDTNQPYNIPSHVDGWMADVTVV